MNVLCAGVLSRAIDSANVNHNFKNHGGEGGGGRMKEEEEKERREGRMSVSGGVLGDSMSGDDTVRAYVRSASVTVTGAVFAACVCSFVAVCL